jgi:hypothetical protein
MFELPEYEHGYAEEAAERQRRRGLWQLVIAGAVLVGALLAWWLW